MIVGDDEFDPAGGPIAERAQNTGPEYLGFGRPCADAQHLAPGILVDADGGIHRLSGGATPRAP